MMKKKESESGKVVCTNKKAYHDFTIEQVIEAGMVLNGPEIKSLRAGRANLPGLESQ